MILWHDDMVERDFMTAAGAHAEAVPAFDNTDAGAAGGNQESADARFGLIGAGPESIRSPSGTIAAPCITR
jgi:hypothetical protein